MTTEQAIQYLENQEQILIYNMAVFKIIGVVIAFVVFRVLYKYYFVSLFKWLMNRMPF